MAGALVGGMISSALNMAQMGLNYAQNQKQFNYQKELNEQMRNDAHNAFTIATADRLRAGLSPLDTNSAEVPSLSSTSQNPYSDLSSAGSAIQQGIQEHINNSINATRLRNEQNLSNAQSAKLISETLQEQANLQEFYDLKDSRLSALRSEYKNISDKGSKEAQQMANQILIQEKELAKMKEQISNLSSQTQRNMYDLEWYGSVGLPVGAPLTTASAGFAMGRAIANGKQSDDVISADEKRQNDAMRKQLDAQNRAGYNKYVSEYETKKKELDQKVYRKELSVDDAKKILGTKMTFGRWVQIYGY